MISESLALINDGYCFHVERLFCCVLPPSFCAPTTVDGSSKIESSCEALCGGLGVA